MAGQLSHLSVRMHAGNKRADTKAAAEEIMAPALNVSWLSYDYRLAQGGAPSEEKPGI